MQDLLNQSVQATVSQQPEKNIDINHGAGMDSIMPPKPADTEQIGSKYPYYPFASALKIAEAIKDLGGARSPVKQSLIAKQLEASENSAAFAQQLSSARTFGLIEGRGDRQLSEIGKKYFFPTSDSDKLSAQLDAFATPIAFAGLLKRFDGDKLPSRDILSNILHRDLGVPESWKDRAAALFSSSAQAIGIIDSQGFLRFEATRHSGGAATAALPPIPEQSGEMVIAPLAAGRSELKSSTKPSTEWRHKEILLHTPEDMDAELWDKLNLYVQLLKPSTDI